MNEGRPAAPILVVAHGDDRNRFHGYVEEILLAEGLPWFRRHDLAVTPLTRAALAAADVAIVSSVDLSADQCETILAHVADGGTVLALRPPRALAEPLGLIPAAPIRHDGQTHVRAMVDRWTRVDTSHPLATGIAARDLQVHGRADLCTWSGDASAVVAWLAPYLGELAPHPAIVAAPHGRGRVVLYTFDLAASTVLFHQGQREHSSIGLTPDYDGDATFRSTDLFTGYIDPRLKDVPQADVHQDLFVRLLEWLVEERPLPRLWYFPAGAPAVAFFNGDGDGMSERDLQAMVTEAERYGAPYTSYVMLDNYSMLPPAWEAELRARGHGFGQHAWAGPMPTLDRMRAQLHDELAAFAERYGHRAVSYRGHWVVWVGWTEMAKYLHENGVRLDTNFTAGLYLGQGYINGSGLPVKFMDEDGQVVDVYEQCTMSADDVWMTDKAFVPARSIEECIAASRRQLEDACQRYHTVYHPYFHPIHSNPKYLDTLPWFGAMLSAAGRLGVPAVRDEDWVRFNDARRALTLEYHAFDLAGARLTFHVRAAHPIAGATLLLPSTLGDNRVTTATVDGDPALCAVKTLEGRPRATIIADFAANQVRRFDVTWR